MEIDSSAHMAEMASANTFNEQTGMLSAGPVVEVPETHNIFGWIEAATLVFNNEAKVLVVRFILRGHDWNGVFDLPVKGEGVAEKVSSLLVSAFVDDLRLMNQKPIQATVTKDQTKIVDLMVISSVIPHHGNIPR